MAAIVQWLERRLVVPNVEGSTPSSRPIKFLAKFSELFLDFPHQSPKFIIFLYF